ncbi:hypothetical protein [Paenisporosarcina cavernae]|uniref:Uncharacterized protein n=1 Tax=Paenisporosarcina cavernae TaxID=2320858 RepID=A0A385YT90_9BACL|nr:hypothetical protein [Paenisporosarcina cavernae]AYC30085.1 hypothetical protein D3873_09445 [Paenisporosarcina cavernae]
MKNSYNNFQRVNSLSNAHVGRDFEEVAKKYFRQEGIELVKDVALEVGISENKKLHRFDLGTLPDASQKVIVECKSHRWTSSGNTPSSKLTVWNEAMYYFYLAPPGYQKIFFILKDLSVKRNETLADYYVRTYSHMIPKDVEFLEYDDINQTVRPILLR